MKNKYTKLFLLIVVLFNFKTTYAEILQLQLKVNGLTCSMCSRATHKQLVKLPFVSDVEVNLKETSFNLNLKKDIPIQLEEIKKSVEEAGFAVGQLKIKVDQVPLNNNKIKIGNDWVYLLNYPNNNSVYITIVSKGYLSKKEWQLIEKKYFTKITEYNKDLKDANSLLGILN